MRNTHFSAKHYSHTQDSTERWQGVRCCSLKVLDKNETKSTQPPLLLSLRVDKLVDTLLGTRSMLGTKFLQKGLDPSVTSSNPGGGDGFLSSEICH